MTPSGRFGSCAASVDRSRGRPPFLPGRRIGVWFEPVEMNEWILEKLCGTQGTSIAGKQCRAAHVMECIAEQLARRELSRRGARIADRDICLAGQAGGLQHGPRRKSARRQSYMLNGQHT